MTLEIISDGKAILKGMANKPMAIGSSSSGKLRCYSANEGVIATNDYTLDEVNAEVWHGGKWLTITTVLQNDDRVKCEGTEFRLGQMNPAVIRGAHVLLKHVIGCRGMFVENARNEKATCRFMGSGGIPDPNSPVMEFAIMALEVAR